MPERTTQIHFHVSGPPMWVDHLEAGTLRLKNQITTCLHNLIARKDALGQAVRFQIKEYAMMDCTNWPQKGQSMAAKALAKKASKGGTSENRLEIAACRISWRTSELREIRVSKFPKNPIPAGTGIPGYLATGIPGISGIFLIQKMAFFRHFWRLLVHKFDIK